MGIKHYFKQLFQASDAEENSYEATYYDDNSVTTPSRKVVHPTKVKDGKEMAHISIMEPRVYSEVEGMAEILLHHQAIIVNFRRMEKSQASRIIDYLTGIIYAIQGNVQKLENDLFLFSPSNFTIDGSLDGEDSELSKLDFIDAL